MFKGGGLVPKLLKILYSRSLQFVYPVCLIKMYKFTKLPLNKFINFFFLKKRVILNDANKKLP